RSARDPLVRFGRLGLYADRLTVFTVHHDRGRTGRALLGAAGIGVAVPFGVRVLNVDEHRGQVFVIGNARDFTTHRADQEALGCAGFLINVIHRVVAENTGRAGAGASIGLHPQAAFRVDADTIGAGERVAVDVAFEVLGFQLRAARQQEHFPGEGGGQGRIAVLFPTN